LMIVQYTAAAIVNDLATRAHPACVYSVPTSANAEDHVSMGTNDGRHAWQMVQDLEQVQAIELLCATQALEYRLQILDAAQKLATTLGVQGLRGKIRHSSTLNSDEAETFAADVKRLQADLRKLVDVKASLAARTVLQATREAGIAFMAHDRLLSPDMSAAIELIRARTILKSIENGLKIELALQD
jgi:histidine ammonia-lyase